MSAKSDNKKTRRALLRLSSRLTHCAAIDDAAGRSQAANWHLAAVTYLAEHWAALGFPPRQAKPVGHPPRPINRETRELLSILAVMSEALPSRIHRIGF